MPSPIVVLQSFPDPRPTTNPYVVMLRDALQAREDVEVRTFSWRRALVSRYDVVHLHWPEILVDGHSPAKAAARQLLTAVLVLRWEVQRTPVVRTRHNLDLPQGISRRERLLLRWIERVTTAVVVLNPDTPVDHRPVTLVPHGHYRDWFADVPRRVAEPGRLAFVGLVRRYKGVEQLLDLFAEVADPTLRLRVAGRPSSDDLAAEITARADRDDRVATQLSFLTDAELVTEVTAAELVVLPYREMHNSGGALTALSLDRPVLVPGNAVTRALAREVGPGWVVTYDGDLSPTDLVRALAEVRARPAGSSPDLSARDWERAGDDHERAYRAAVAVRGGAYSA